MIATISTSGHRRLEQLYEVSKLFNAFASVDETVGKALQVVAATLPLESALLIHAGIACHTEIIMWRCADNPPGRLLAARSHAEALYTYLVGARSVDTLDVHDRAGAATLPAPRDRRVVREHTRRFIMIPLVVARGMVFGALQLEAASDPDRDDVEFVSALANQLAIALDRDRTRRHDVVRRREAQLSRARCENVVDRLDAAFVWEADLESHRISYVSAQFEELLGFSRRECLDERDWWMSHVHPDDRRLLEHTFARALAERGSQRCDHRVIAWDNAILWLHTSMHVADVPGEAPRFQGLSCDITAARTEQDRVRDQLAFASAVMTSLGEGTLVVDLEGVITFINDVGASLLGVSRGEVLGRPTAGMARVVDREGTALECPLATAMRTGAGVHSDDHLVLRADESWFRASYTAAAVRRDGCVIGAVLEFHVIIERGNRRRRAHPARRPHDGSRRARRIRCRSTARRRG
jgi:PAS domain S-box-containing protein